MAVDSEHDPPEDDGTISDETDLFRRVPPDHYKLVAGEFVLRDGAFKNFPHPERKRMSVVLGDTLTDAGREPESVRSPEQSNFGVVAISAGEVRAEEQRIERSPLDEEPAHGDVFGEKPGARRKRFARVARWVVYPDLPQAGA